MGKNLTKKWNLYFDNACASINPFVLLAKKTPTISWTLFWWLLLVRNKKGNVSLIKKQNTPGQEERVLDRKKKADTKYKRQTQNIVDDFSFKTRWPLTYIESDIIFLRPVHTYRFRVARVSQCTSRNLFLAKSICSSTFTPCFDGKMQLNLNSPVLTFQPWRFTSRNVRDRDLVDVNW